MRNEEIVIQGQGSVMRRSIKTPRAAAVAGILFALLYGTALVLIRLSIPDKDATVSGAWLETSSGTVAFALNLVPYAGIAFLWFIGVIRDRLGDSEDRFIATVFLGSGLLFLALTFVGAALAGALLTSYADAGGGAGSESISLWVTLIFPGWVLAVSAYLLTQTKREDFEGATVEKGTP
jgi:hypothetical protein